MREKIEKNKRTIHFLVEWTFDRGRPWFELGGALQYHTSVDIVKAAESSQKLSLDILPGGRSDRAAPPVPKTYLTPYL